MKTSTFTLHNGTVISLVFDIEKGTYDVIETVVDGEEKTVLSGIDGKEAIDYAVDQFNKHSPTFKNKDKT